ncbi:hypothetical protein [Bacillus nitratireducens]|uniref:hypothetical protein n=1 Tax=Bacillus nitratireducens TaxID=2026193 RepID=UPI002E1A8FA3|nr:hypothetical protein [Bacillus nitratireducens]
MNTLAYGKLLSDIGKKICDMSNNAEKNTIQTLNNNINIYKDALQQLKDVEPPSIFSHEHAELTSIFTQLIISYSLQINNINDEEEIINKELFNKNGNLVVQSNLQH